MGIGVIMKALSNVVIKGSIADIAKNTNKSIAETFASASVIVLVDTSASMETDDSRGGKTRYEVACEELAAIQGQLPGKIAVISFSSDAVFCPNGQPLLIGAGTNMVAALNFAKIADLEGVRFILISDGEPDDSVATLSIARTYKNRIDTIFVGPEGGAGAQFLTRLAKTSGGQTVTADRAKELAPTIQHLLAA